MGGSMRVTFDLEIEGPRLGFEVPRIDARDPAWWVEEAVMRLASIRDRHSCTTLPAR
jgi:hypothetical protein